MFQCQYAHHCSRLLLLVAFVFSSFLGGCGDDGATGDNAAGSGGDGDAGGGAAGSTPGGLSGGAGGSSGAAGADEAGAGGSTGGGNTAPLYGYFDVTLNPALDEAGTAASTGVIGKVYDGAVPVPVTLQQKQEAGSCKLLTPMPVFCSPTCTGGAVCVTENTCMPAPTAKTVGTVTVTGLGSSAISMNPIANNYQPPAGTTIPYPGCTPGSELKLEAAGGEHSPFTLTTTCVAPLEAATSIEIVRGQALMLQWNAAADASKSKVDVVIDISQHGTSKGRIECELPDTGSHAVPATLIDALVDLGFSGFPTVLLTRESESVAGAGGQSNVKFRVKAPFRQAIEIEGLTSCNSDDNCPQGQTCQADLKCQ